MRLDLERQRITFLQGMLSAFSIHPDRTFRDWMDDNCKRTDIENLKGDLIQVGSDMQKATSKLIGPVTSR